MNEISQVGTEQREVADSSEELDLGSVPGADQFDDAQLEQHRDEMMSLVHSPNRDIDFDPIVHLQTGAVIGSEALALLPDGLTTAQWFSLAHAMGAGINLELSVLDAVIKRYRSETNGFVGVNASADALIDPGFLSRLTNVDDDRVVVELTGQTSLPSLGKLRMTIAKVRSTGARLAIHVADLGTTSLRSIATLEPDVIKINPALTMELASGQADTAATRNFFERCRRDGIFVVAVGVERLEQLQALESQSVDAYQGWLARGTHPGTTLDH